MDEPKLLTNPVFEFRIAYRDYLRKYHKGERPPRAEVDRLRGLLPGELVDKIAFEVEKEVGVGTVNPKNGH